MQSNSGIAAVSIPVSEIVVAVIGLLAAFLVFWIVRKRRQTRNRN
jgi:hypothetical protein